MRAWDMSLQENDIEREANIHRDKRDYNHAEGWKWILSGET